MPLVDCALLPDRTPHQAAAGQGRRSAGRHARRHEPPHSFRIFKFLTLINSQILLIGHCPTALAGQGTAPATRMPARAVHKGSGRCVQWKHAVRRP